MLEVLEKRRRILGDEARGTLVARNNLAALYMETGRPSEAEAYLVETLTAQRKVLGDVHPETLLSMLNLGSLYLGLNRVDEALLLARELMEHGSQSHQHYEHFKQFHEATLEQLGKAESGPSLSQLNNRAWALIDPDRTDKETDVALGLRLARAAVEAAPGDSGIRNTLAWALFANGLYDEAIAVSEKALELAPEAEKDAYQGYLDRLRSMIAEAQQQPAGAGTGD
jgi:tetratricopeptide (TPR) repeat protein